MSNLNLQQILSTIDNEKIQKAQLNVRAMRDHNSTGSSSSGNSASVNSRPLRMIAYDNEMIDKE